MAAAKFLTTSGIEVNNGIHRGSHQISLSAGFQFDPRSLAVQSRAVGLCVHVLLLPAVVE